MQNMSGKHGQKGDCFFTVSSLITALDFLAKTYSFPSTPEAPKPGGRTAHCSDEKLLIALPENLPSSNEQTGRLSDKFATFDVSSMLLCIHVLQGKMLQTRQVEAYNCNIIY